MDDNNSYTAKIAKREEEGGLVNNNAFFWMEGCSFTRSSRYVYVARDFLRHDSLFVLPSQFGVFLITVSRYISKGTHFVSHLQRKYTLLLSIKYFKGCEDA